MQFLQYLLTLKRTNKRIISVLIDVLFILSAFWLSLIVRLDTTNVLINYHLWILVVFVCPVSIFAFIKFGLYKAILRYMSSKAMSVIAIGVAISAVSIVVISYFFNVNIPRTVPIIYFAFAIIFIGGSRLILRSILATGLKRSGEAVIIYGAGVSGRQLMTSLMQSQEYHPCAFVDDDHLIQGSLIQGVRVYSPKLLSELANSYSVKIMLMAMPSATKIRRKEILKNVEYLPLHILTIPSMADLVSGKEKLSNIKEVDIDDLLGRDCILPRQDLMSSNTTNKIVMVTGAGGSIGSELCRQIIMFQPKKLILFEVSEYALYAIEREVKLISSNNGFEIEILPLIGSVQKESRILAILKNFHVQTVYHAAAYKHVPLVEHNVIEGVRNNIFGTLFMARAAIAASVETFVLISTDKAVRPTNVMGTTKRIAELILQALSKENNATRFCMVRFGNVLGSSGSVVPLFRKQIATGGPVTVTHPDITRYFMTIPEASQLVIQAGAMGKGGDVFVLDMGESVKIVDLARKMIHLSGYTINDQMNSEGDIKIEFSGLRPGEKLYEELLIGDNVIETHHERIMTANEDFLPMNELQIIIDKLDVACNNFDHELIRKILLAAPTGFSPSDGISDLLWLEKKKSNVLSLIS